MDFSFFLISFLLFTAFFSTWAIDQNYSSSSSGSKTISPAAAATAAADVVDDDSHSSSMRSICKSTPYPEICFNSLKLSISININPNIISSLLSSLQVALSEAAKLPGIFTQVEAAKVIEKQRGAMEDCKELHQITISYLQKSQSSISSLTTAEGAARKKLLADSRSFLAAALTNKNTCLEGLDFATGPLIRPYLVDSLIDAYKHVSNSLSLLPRSSSEAASGENIDYHEGTGQASGSSGEGHDQFAHQQRHLLAATSSSSKWLSRRILQSEESSGALVVAADGTGNFSTIMEAINFAPNDSDDRIIIYVKKGLYRENVDIPSYKTNIVLLGDSRDNTIITGSRSFGDGWTTYRSATLAVSGNGFLARDMTIENNAGPEKHQAVALRVNADLAAIYRCTIHGYQDTLYVHSLRQFYRECDIYGTIDFIFGNAAVVFQACNIISRMPMPGQYITITAQSRDSPDQDTGISIQNCSILATDELYSNVAVVKSYFGRPWRSYSRVVYIESYIDDFIEPTGWIEWVGRQDGENDLDTLYYGEYQNAGSGSVTGNRVTWSGYHIMDYTEASDFTVSEFITGYEWLDSTSFPYDNGV